MNEELFQQVYDTVRGLRVSDVAEGVENAFEPGSFCDRRYGEMLAAYARLCERLGVREEDADVEVIISALLDIQEALCRMMFHYGENVPLLS